MEKMTLVSKSFVKDSRGGAEFTQTIILTALIALACIAAFRYFGQKVSAKVQEQGDAVEAINP